MPSNTLDKLLLIKRVASDLMDEHGLIEDGWTFRFHAKKRALATCYFKQKCIAYSKHFLDEPYDQVRDTILHEIAHALVGPGHGHDITWQRMAIQVGANPSRTVETVSKKPRPNFVIKCDNPACPRPVKLYRYRLRKELIRSYYCKACGGNLSAYKLIYK